VIDKTGRNPFDPRSPVLFDADASARKAACARLTLDRRAMTGHFVNL
jgi:hypothetical protein